MRPETKVNLVLAAKSVLLALGGLIAVAAIVELRVGGPSVRAFTYLVVGLALALPPLVLAFRDAAAAHKRGERASNDEPEDGSGVRRKREVEVP